MVTVVDNISELINPVAEDDHSCSFGKLKVQLDMAVAIDKIVDIGVILDIFLGVENQMFTVFTHIGRLLTIILCILMINGQIKLKCPICTLQNLVFKTVSVPSMLQTK